MVTKKYALLVPNNFSHKAGDGLKTRKRNIAFIHPALQANCGSTQATYLLEVEHEPETKKNVQKTDQKGKKCNL